MGNLIRYYDSISTVYSSLINLTISFHTKKIIKFLAGVAVYVAVQKQNQLFPKAISISTFHYLNTSHIRCALEEELFEQKELSSSSERSIENEETLEEQVSSESKIQTVQQPQKQAVNEKEVETKKTVVPSSVPEQTEKTEKTTSLPTSNNVIDSKSKPDVQYNEWYELLTEFKSFISRQNDYGTFSKIVLGDINSLMMCLEDEELKIKNDM